jgi:hypothetical protein
MKKKIQILSVITIVYSIMIVSCTKGSSSEKPSSDNVNTEAISKNIPLSLSKDVGLDSIVIIYTATFWANKYKFVIQESSAILNGTEFKEKRYGEYNPLKDPTGPTVELSDSDRIQLVEKIDELFVSKKQNIIAKKYKTSDYIESEFPEIKILLYKDGLKSDFFVHKVETQNGYQIIYSKEFEDFTDRLFVLAGEYSYPGWHFE